MALKNGATHVVIADFKPSTHYTAVVPVEERTRIGLLSRLEHERGRILRSDESVAKDLLDQAGETPIGVGFRFNGFVIIPVKL